MPEPIIFPYLATSPDWADTGIVVLPGAYLAITATGEVIWSNVGSLMSYPEGSYQGQESDVYDPSLVDIYALGDHSQYPVVPGPGAPVYSLMLLVLPEGEAPPLHPTLPGGVQVTQGYLYPTRSRVFSGEEVAAAGGGGGPWRIWAILNDDLLTDNSGSFGLTGYVGEPGEGLPARPPAPTIRATGFWNGDIPQINVSGE